MVRKIPAGRLLQLVTAATEVFVAQGYQRTQIEDVARALGVAKGTLYGYVQSKEALFDAALRYADGLERLPDNSALPLRTPAPGATVAYVRQRLASEVQGLELLAVLGREAPRDVGAELSLVIGDLYTRMERNRHGIKLVDRCALDRPELVSVWFGDGRWGQHALLVQYLEKRIAEGALRPIRCAAVVARVVLETIAFWAVHRHWDPSPQHVVEEDVQGSVVDLLLRGLLKEAS